MENEQIAVVVILGLQGAGKDAALDYLVSEHGFAKASASDYLRKEAKKMGFPLDYDVLKDVGDIIRAREGKGAAVRNTVRRLVEKGKTRIAVGSLRHLEEYKELKQDYKTVMIAVDANYELRMQRVFERNREGDPKTSEEFRRRDLIDKHEVFDLDELFKLVDATIENTRTLEEYYRNISEGLQKLGISSIEGQRSYSEKR